ncbi:MAG: carboxypeptidase regulatory-like domain-containing protein, partial [Chitinophagales bacterium]
MNWCTLVHFILHSTPKKNFLTIILIEISSLIYAQPTQTIRGAVTDYDSKISLIGVNVVVMKDSSIISGATTDEDGNYKIEKVPVGRFKVKFSYIGYQQQTIDNVIV